MQALKLALQGFGERTAVLGLWLAAAALLAIVGINGLNIVLRYFFLDALSWAEEAMDYLMVFSVYAGAVSVAWRQVHIRIDAVLNLAPLRYRRAANAASTLLLVAILTPVTVASYDVVRQLYEFDQRSDAMHLPMWIPQGIVPAALFLIMVMALMRIWLYEPVTDGDDAPLAEPDLG
jgi:TRAP-type C4-dicarboxylate transport system permease small subunit